MKFKIKLKPESNRKLPCLLARAQPGISEANLVVLFTGEKLGTPIIRSGRWVNTGVAEDWIHYTDSNWTPCSVVLTRKQ